MPCKQCPHQNVYRRPRRQLKPRDLNVLKHHIVKHNWKLRIRNETLNNSLAEIMSQSSRWIVHNISHPMFPVYNQIFSGHNRLNFHLSRIGVVDSPNCVTCQEPETVVHFLYHCERYTRSRRQFLNTIRDILIGDYQPRLFTDLDLATLAGQKKSLNCKTNQKLCQALLDFIKETNRF